MDHDYLQFAVDLQKELDLHFLDQSEGGYFFTGDYTDLHMARLKESYDGAVPSGNSVELTNLITLWKLTGESSYLEHASGIESVFGENVSGSPRGYSMMLSGIMYGQQGGTEVELEGDTDNPVMLDILDVLRSGYRPWTTVKFAEASSGLPVKAFVCRNGTCSLPVETAGELVDAL